VVRSMWVVWRLVVVLRTCFYCVIRFSKFGECVRLGVLFFISLQKMVSFLKRV